MNRVYRAVEGKAHGLVGFLPYEWGIVAGAFVLGAMIQIFVGAGAAAAAIAVLGVGRRGWDQRREWLKLWLRRFERRRRYRVLDSDVDFKPYGGRKAWRSETTKTTAR